MTPSNRWQRQFFDKVSWNLLTGGLGGNLTEGRLLFRLAGISGGSDQIRQKGFLLPITNVGIPCHLGCRDMPRTIRKVGRKNMGVARPTFPDVSAKSNVQFLNRGLVLPGKLLAGKRDIESITRFLIRVNF